MEDTILRLLKRFMLVVIGSGLLGNALYIHGLAYYEGYVDQFGFDYNLFPIPSSEVLFWTYYASRELGAASIITLMKFKTPLFFTVVASVYLLSRIWMESSNKRKVVNKRPPKKHKIKLYKKIYRFRENHSIIFYTIYVPIRWLILKEQSFIAFIASYFSLIILFFIPLFLIIWVYFPLIGLEHGRSVAKSHIEYYSENLCGDSNDFWSNCIEITTEHIKLYKAPNVVKGKIILRSGSLLGIYTENAPITISIPNEYYFKTIKNPRYEPKKKA